MHTVRTKDIKWLTSVVFESSKRTARVDATGKVTFHTTNWFEGSLNEYAAVELATLEQKALKISSPWANVVEGKTIDVPAGFAIVERSIFCGKEMPLIVYLNPINAIKFLSTNEKS